MSLPAPMPVNWSPTAKPDEVRAEFPDIDVKAVLAAFKALAKTRNKRSADWDQEFWLFCEYRQRQAAERLKASRDTDSLGLPLDPKKRAKMQKTTEGDYGIRFLARLEHHQALGLTADEAHAAAVADLEGESE